MTAGKIKRVALIYPAMEGADYIVPDKMEYGIKRSAQLGFQYLSAALRTSGTDCTILDQSVTQFDLPTLMRILKGGRYDLVGFYSDTMLKPKVADFIRQLNRNGFGKPVIVGGPGSFDYKVYLDAGAQIVCHGEGEKTIVEVVEYFNGKRKAEDLRGVNMVIDGSELELPSQEPIENLDSLPFPDRSQYTPNTYYDYHYFGMRQPYMSMMTSRGCPNQCSFCSSSAVLGRKVRTRSAENVLEEIDQCTAEFGLRYIGFKDDIFGLKKDWTEQFAKGLIARNSPVSFAVNLFPFSFKNRAEPTLALLKKAGLDQVVVGLQSVDRSVLKNINRHPDEPEHVARIVSTCKNLGITVVVEFIFGLPGDTKETMRRALDYSLKVRPHHALFYVLSVLDGSEIMDKYGEKGPDTGFSDEELRKRCADYQKHFYTRPAVFAGNVFHILKNNPLWFFRIMRYWRYFIDAIGFKKKRIKG